jgi:fido (protein-threonine AMPylation protein)
VILYEILGTEANAAYQELEIANGERQYDFIRSLVSAALQLNRAFLSQAVIKALNYHAIACLHTNAGEFRPCGVIVGSNEPPAPHRVQAIMDDFINNVNREWNTTDPIYLATYVLWRLNHIHPFINGNGRTARAAAYFVLCAKLGGMLKGSPILPELLKMNRGIYVAALKMADASIPTGKIDLGALYALVLHLLSVQTGSTPQHYGGTPNSAGLILLPPP